MSTLAAKDRALVRSLVERPPAKVGRGGSKGPRAAAPPAPTVRPEHTRKGGLSPRPARHCPWCGYQLRGRAPACEQCIDLEAALHEHTEPGVTFHGAAPGSDRNGA